MRSSSSALSTLVVIFCLFVIISAVPALAQDSSGSVQAVGPRLLITAPIDESQLTRLKGNTHPLARPQFDLGTAPASLPMQRMLLVLKRSPEQESALKKLLDDQQDKNSPNYHKWMTPEQFGKQFGPSDADMQTITGWLQSHGFEVGSTKGRTILEFSGSASQVQEAFHTSIHKYVVNGEQHWANASDPMIPTALVSAVAGVKTLHNFISKPQIHFEKQPAPAKFVPGKKPEVTFPPQNGQPQLNALGPEDYATIYDINPVYNLPITGSGVTIGVVGRTDLYNGGSDVSAFHGVFGLPVSGQFQSVFNGPDPGDLGGGEEAEATLDVTWSSSISYGATVDFVVSSTTNNTDGVDLSELYIVENNLADIMTESFGSCEYFATDADLAGVKALAQQAAAQGISYFVSTGDNGAEGCDDPSNPPARFPISVNMLASTPYNIAVGGTMFNENGNVSKYWTSVQRVAETAISYIPEDVWNESSLSNGLWAGSGGASAGNIQNGGSTAGVPKPSWQFGVTGIPTDGVRDLPDVSLTAAGHDPYLLCLEASCENNFIYFVSGTSASAPSFAGIMALVDQQMSMTTGQTLRQGQANYVLYPLAASQSIYPTQCDGSSTSTSPATTCVFNDVITGNNVVPGELGTEYQAGSGYDLATGLGSVNVANLVKDWTNVQFHATTTTLTLKGVASGNTTPVSITHGSTVPVDITVTSGSGTPAGDVSLIAETGPNGSLTNQTGVAFFTLDSSGATTGASTTLLPGGGPYSVVAHYAGNTSKTAMFAPSDSGLPGVQVIVAAESSTTTLSQFTQNSGGGISPLGNGSTLPFGSLVYVRADVAGSSGVGVPTGSVNFSDSGTCNGNPCPFRLPSSIRSRIRHRLTARVIHRLVRESLTSTRAITASRASIKATTASTQAPSAIPSRSQSSPASPESRDWRMSRSPPLARPDRQPSASSLPATSPLPSRSHVAACRLRPSAAQHQRPGKDRIQL